MAEPLASADSLYNVTMEQALLGALFLDNTIIETVSEFLRPQHFGSPLHGRIYEAVIVMSERGQVADPISLRPYLGDEAMLAQAGGGQYLLDLTEAVISIAGATDYGRIIHDLALRRQLVRIGEDVSGDAKQVDFDSNAIQLIEGAEKQLYDLATAGAMQRGAVSFHSALAEAVRSVENAYTRESQVVGVTSGFTDLDKMLGGLHSSDLIILAGRPSMGKTALATNIAFNAAKAKHHQSTDGAAVVFFSLEMSAEQLATRILSAESQISSDEMRRGAIDSSAFTRLLQVSREINGIQLFIDDTPALTISGLRNRARRLKRQHDIGLIVVDYLQLLETGGPGKGRGGDSGRVQEISEISRGLKAVAKELNVPVIALSQLSRAVEQRDDKRPQLSDLRESGSIEQDADVVMFVFRGEYYEERRQPAEASHDKHREWQGRMDVLRNKAEVIIAKQRHGPVGSINLFFDGRLTRFGNLAR